MLETIFSGEKKNKKEKNFDFSLGLKFCNVLNPCHLKWANNSFKVKHIVSGVAFIAGNFFGWWGLLRNGSRID